MRGAVAAITSVMLKLGVMAFLAHFFDLWGGCCQVNGCEGFKDSGFKIQRFKI
jgi:hypothetical protein